MYSFLEIISVLIFSDCFDPKKFKQKNIFNRNQMFFIYIFGLKFPTILCTSYEIYNNYKYIHTVYL